MIHVFKNASNDVGRGKITTGPLIYVNCLHVSFKFWKKVFQYFTTILSGWKPSMCLMVSLAHVCAPCTDGIGVAALGLVLSCCISGVLLWFEYEITPVIYRSPWFPACSAVWKGCRTFRRWSSAGGSWMAWRFCSPALLPVRSLFVDCWCNGTSQPPTPAATRSPVERGDHHWPLVCINYLDMSFKVWKIVFRYISRIISSWTISQNKLSVELLLFYFLKRFIHFIFFMCLPPCVSVDPIYDLWRS